MLAEALQTEKANSYLKQAPNPVWKHPSAGPTTDPFSALRPTQNWPSSMLPCKWVDLILPGCCPLKSEAHIRHCLLSWWWEAQDAIICPQLERMFQSALEHSTKNYIDAVDPWILLGFISYPLEQIVFICICFPLLQKITTDLTAWSSTQFYRSEGQADTTQFSAWGLTRPGHGVSYAAAHFTSVNKWNSYTTAQGTGSPCSAYHQQVLLDTQFFLHKLNTFNLMH